MAVGTCLFARGASETVGSGTITYEGATPTWVGSELVLTYTDPAAAGSLSVGGYAKVDYLVVAGGGAGGTMARKGGGGGGGAGGVVYAQDVVLTNAAYVVVVGAGGAAAANNDAVAPGGNGGDSSFGDFARATGGGGGGAGTGTDGLGGDGGSGGGGANKQSGGAATGNPAQGSAGGSSSSVYFGAGGGGAAGQGGAGTALDRAGGDGTLCDITGEALYYAGGGAGGRSSSGAVALGGSGVGGSGGGYNNASAATAGAANTGSGGGGGGRTTPGASGGSGIVVVRILDAVDAVPTPAGGEHPYTGSEQVMLEPRTWLYTIDGTAAATDVGSYSFTATLQPGLNLTWDDGTDTPTSVVWSITQAVNAITGLVLPGWREGTMPNVPTCTANFGTPSYTYSETEDGEYETWDLATLTAGTYYVKATVDETANYKGASAVASFTVYPPASSPLKELGRFAPVTLDYTGETLTNFVLLVKISEESIPGFSYNTAYLDGSDVRFCDWDGNLYDHDIDEWHTDGTSLVWVKIPEFSASTELVMCWGPVAGETLADADETKTWSDYAGVWHFNEEISSETAATAASADATGHGLDARPAHGTGTADGDLARMVSTGSGAIGRARVNDSQAIIQGNYLRVPYQPELDVTGKLTVSYWVKVDANTPDSNRSVLLASRKTNYNNAGGWESEFKANGTQIRQFGGSGGFFDATISASSLVDHETYDFVAVAFDDTTSVVYGGDQMGGRFYATTNTSIAAVSACTRDLAIGNNLDGNGTSVCGAFDEFRLCKVTRTAPWLEADYAQVTNGSYAAFELASATQGVAYKNHWLVEPSFSWDNETKTATCDAGSAAAAGSVSSVKYIRDLDGQEVALDEASATPGAYSVVITATAKDYADMTETFAFTVSPEAEDYTALTSASGRVLLMNRDNNALGPVERQGYSDTSTSGETFWKRLNTTAVDATETYNLKSGTEFELWTKNYGRKLWHLVDIRQGNTFETGDTGSGTLMTDQNYLPWSSTSFSIVDRMNLVGNNRKDVGQLVMRNSTDACVYSPCYDEGIGTIYFDAVNGWVSNDGSDYRLVVQVATNCFADAAHQIVTNVPPTDANIKEFASKEFASEDPTATETGVTAGALNAFANWQNVTLSVLKRDGTASFDEPFTTEELALAVKTGGSIGNFYRVFADVVAQLGDYRGPVRFRIKRVSALPSEDMSIDGGGFILLDNIIASYPAMRADLRPVGGDEAYRKEASGDQVLGWRNAFMTPFPSITDGGVRARGEVLYTTNTAVEASTESFVTTAKMSYRWRYLSQAFDPEDASSWKTVSLDPANGFVSPEGILLDLPDTGTSGDIEFRYALELNAPYYAYVDYSGTGLGVPGFSERISVVTNAYSGASLAGQTRGSDWFVRLREGASLYEGLTLVVSNSYDIVTTNAMTLVADDTWRATYETPTNAADRLWFRVEGVNPQTAGSTEYNVETKRWRVVLSEGSSLSIGEPVTLVADDGETFGGELAVDATTGYLLFQIDTSAEAPSVTVVHADWQNFNRWSDASGHDYVGTSTNYVGTSTDPTSMSGVSSAKRDWQEDFETWNDMPATNNFWRAPSPDWTTTGDDDQFYGRTAYEPFSSDTTGAWSVGPGMWVSKKYHVPNNGVALQMAGQGKGYLQYVDNVEYPRGLDTVSFNARLAQPVGANDFTYYDAEKLLALTNYTFTTLAAFDQKGMTSFSGNASLSLVAHYIAKRGFYEARLEQYGASTNNGQRLVLYRWNNTAENGKWRWTRTKLHTYNNPTSFSAPASSEAAHNPFYITVSNTTAGVYVMAGVRRTGLTPMGARRATGSGNTTPADLAQANWWNIGYLDTSADQIRYGTYGVLSASCEGVFLDTMYWPAPIGPFSALHADNTGEWSNQAVTMFSTVTPVNRRPTADSDEWRNWEGRMEPLNESDTQWGLRAAEAMETLEIYTAPFGKDTWGDEPVATTNITGFGSVGSVGSSHFDIKLHTLDNCSVRLKVGGDEEDMRTDITVSDVEFTQWRGADWADMDTSLIPGYKSGIAARYATISFATAWIKDHALLLSARRTKPGSPSAIYSPLMDDYEYELGVKSGLGLGMIAFRYENAQTNANILVQIATNNVSRASFGSDIDTFSADVWTTVTNYTFSGENAMPASGVCSTYIGLHGVKGMMRIVVDNDLVTALAEATDETAFGDITITEVLCSDEPELDARSWWGWNLRTVGDTGKDTEGRMLLADFDTTGGKSMALNNSVTLDIDETEADVYKNNLPFIQTPMFTNANVKIGAISFKARKFDYKASEAANADALNAQPAQVTLYGSKNGSDDGQWDYITDFAISNNFYRTYTCKFGSNIAYRAFRLAVTKVPGVVETNVDSEPDLPDGATGPVRVLLDEVLVSEAVEPRFGFRNFGTIRTDLDKDTIVENVARNKDYQPLCDESWGVQCEIYPAQLAQEIDFSKEIEVYLHWFRGETPWGYENWCTNAAADKALLMLASDATESRRVYRSSYTTNSKSIIPAETKPVCMQYMLEVKYYNVTGQHLSSTVLPSEWEKVAPTWYAPRDCNAENDGFSPYTLLDNIAPGWAWINEANIFGEYESGWRNSDDDIQYVEVAVPAEAQIKGWRVNLLAEGSAGTVVTNTIGIFGVTPDLDATKTNKPAFDPTTENIKPGESTGLDPNMVFRVIASTNNVLNYVKGEVDATWGVFQNHNGMAFTSRDRLGPIYPFGVQLVRASGVVEHEVVCVGTNFYGNSSNYSDYHPTNTVNYLNAHTARGGFFYAGADDGGVPNSLSVISGQGETAECWTNTVVRTPGRINKGQYINPEHPTPNGESIVIYANLDQSGGAITQQIGDGPETSSSQTLFIKKGSLVGTNITYRVEPWYELGSVVTNILPSTEYTPASWVVTGPRTYTLEHVGLGASNTVTVIAKAKVMQDLVDKYNLTEENRYTDAVLAWLKAGKTLKDDFYDPDSDKIYLADYASYTTGEVKGKLDLTAMYWLDIDPTFPWGDGHEGTNAVAFMGQINYNPNEYEVRTRNGNMITNPIVHASLMLTNRVTMVAWAPYVLRGMEPGSTSSGWAADSGFSNWTSVTFKVVGHLNNGESSLTDEASWVPMRLFVFDENSFDPATFTSTIELLDPKSQYSVGFDDTVGWYRWFQTHPGDTSSMFYCWRINGKSLGGGVEVLKKEDKYE